MVGQRPNKITSKFILRQLRQKSRLPRDTRGNGMQQNKHAKNTDLSNIACFITKLAVKKVKGDKTHFGLHKSRLSEYNKYQIEICVVILSQK